MFDVITMGSNTVDAFANADDEIITLKTKAGEEKLIAYPLGSKIVINEMRYSVGGNGVNVGVALSRLGLKTAYLGKIGKDINGQLIKERLQHENVEFIGAEGDQSGFSVILDSPLHQDRTILTYKGCNNFLSFDELDHSKLQAKWFYLTSMMEESYKTMQTVAEHAKNQGMKIAFNPSMTIAKLGFDHLRSILEKTDLLVLNDEEAEAILGKGSIDEHIQKFKDMGIGVVVITLGEHGLRATNEHEAYYAKPGSHCEVVETTGAGDSCTAGFLAGVMMERDFVTCIKMGMINAENVLCRYGAQNKMLNLQEMDEALSHDNREIEKLH